MGRAAPGRNRRSLAGHKPMRLLPIPSAPKQRQQNNHRDWYAQQKQQETSAHYFLRYSIMTVTVEI